MRVIRAITQDTYHEICEALMTSDWASEVEDCTYRDNLCNVKLNSLVTLESYSSVVNLKFHRHLAALDVCDFDEITID